MITQKPEQIIVIPQGLREDEVRVGSLVLSLPDIRRNATFFPDHFDIKVHEVTYDVLDYEFHNHDKTSFGFGVGGLFFLKRLRQKMHGLRVNGKMKVSSMMNQSSVSLDILNDKKVQEWYQKQLQVTNAVRLYIILETYTILSGATWHNEIYKKGFSTTIKVPVSSAASLSAPLVAGQVDPKIELELGSSHAEVTADAPLVVAIRAAEVKIKTARGFNAFGFRVRGQDSDEAVLGVDNKKEYALGSVLLGRSSGQLEVSDEEPAELLVASLDDEEE